MHALSSPMGVECGIACHFGLGGRHALEIERMHWMWDVLFHDCKNSFLSLQRTHAVKGRRDDSDVKVVARSVQVNHLNDSFRNSLSHFCLDPFTADHDDASQ
jgi:hypothetical protein